MADNSQLYTASLKILPDIPIPRKYQRDFQYALETLAADANVPVALIMRVGMDQIEVFGTNTHIENPYIIGETAKLQSGLYCETVMKTGHHLIITNARKDKIWKDNPDISRKMIAYMGLPLYWPRGEVFGTICLLNSREHHFSELEREFIQTVHDAIESDLAKIYQQYCIDYHCEPKVAETTVASRL